MFDVRSPVKLQDYLTYLAYQMDSAGTHYFIFRKNKIIDKMLSSQ